MKKPIIFVNLLISSVIVSLSMLTMAAAPIRPISGPISLAQYSKKPKLVVVVVIDQCRSDFLTRFEKRMRSQSGGGLSYLMKNGAYFPFAKYDILQSMTCPGHATILTGAYPYQMGIPLNDWYDTVKKTDVYCAEDHSPRHLQGSTVGDELKIAGYKSKIVAIALKDRSAIMMGGHRADLALWLEEGQWESSKYYLPDGKPPLWLNKLNQNLVKEKGSVFKWKALGQPSSLTKVSETLSETNGAGILRETIAGAKDSFATQYGVRLTTDAAVLALKELKLGQGSAPDILAISYSSHDMLGHVKGLQSLEMEELTMYEDESIGQLLKAVDQSVGLKNVLFAFTGDHGVAPAVSVVKPQGIPAGVIDTSAILSEVNVALEKKWGKSEKGPWLLQVNSMNFYLDPAVLIDKKKTRTDVEAEVKRIIALPSLSGEVSREGVSQVFTRSEWEEHLLPPGRFERQIMKTFVPGKSGDVVLIPKPFWVDSKAFATHVTGYSYDRSVPLILAGGMIRPGVYANEVEVVDLAPTLSFILGLVAPSGSDGRVLHEVF